MAYGSRRTVLVYGRLRCVWLFMHPRFEHQHTPELTVVVELPTKVLSPHPSYWSRIQDSTAEDALLGE